MSTSLRDVRVRPYEKFIDSIFDQDFDPRPQAIWVGTIGDVVVVDIDGNETVITGVPAGTLLSIRPVRIVSVGTTATKIALFF